MLTQASGLFYSRSPTSTKPSPQSFSVPMSILSPLSIIITRDHVHVACRTVIYVSIQYTRHFVRSHLEASNSLFKIHVSCIVIVSSYVWSFSITLSYECLIVLYVFAYVDVKINTILVLSSAINCFVHLDVIIVMYNFLHFSIVSQFDIVL